MTRMLAVVEAGTIRWNSFFRCSMYDNGGTYLKPCFVVEYLGVDGCLVRFPKPEERRPPVTRRFSVRTLTISVSEDSFGRAEKTARALADAGSPARVVEEASGTCWGWYFPRNIVPSMPRSA